MSESDPVTRCGMRISIADSHGVFSVVVVADEALLALIELPRARA